MNVFEGRKFRIQKTPEEVSVGMSVLVMYDSNLYLGKITEAFKHKRKHALLVEYSIENIGKINERFFYIKNKQQWLPKTFGEGCGALKFEVEK